jgi:transcriptional regulator with XRE-family HTH domain
VARTTPDPNRPDVRFGAKLARIRIDAGVSQVKAARDTGLTQSDVSRTEAGRTRVAAARVRALLGVYAGGENRAGLTSDRIEELVAEAATLEARFADRRIHIQTGSPANTALRARLTEESARRVRSYHPLMVLGVLQTEEYASVVYGGRGKRTTEEVQRLVEDRVKRWATLVAEPDREWVLIQTEWAMRTPLRSYNLQAAQVRRLLVASELPNVRLGVIPLDIVAPYSVAITGFHIYDERELVVTTNLGEARTSTPAHIAGYAARFETLLSLALFGEDARDLLREIESRYLRLGEQP